MRMLVGVFALMMGSVHLVAAAEPFQRPNIEPFVRDISLQEGNTLQGQIVDAQGVPQIRSQVALLQRGQTVRSTQSDSNGRFFIRDLRAGVYQVETNSGGTVIRLWAPNTAPPSAKQVVLIVRNEDVVRGQDGSGIYGRTIVGGALAAGLIGGSVIWAIDYYDDSGS